MLIDHRNQLSRVHLQNSRFARNWLEIYRQLRFIVVVDPVIPSVKFTGKLRSADEWIKAINCVVAVAWNCAADRRVTKRYWGSAFPFPVSTKTSECRQRKRRKKKVFQTVSQLLCMKWYFYPGNSRFMCRLRSFAGETPLLAHKNEINFFCGR